MSSKNVRERDHKEEGAEGVALGNPFKKCVRGDVVDFEGGEGSGCECGAIDKFHCIPHVFA